MHLSADEKNFCDYYLKFGNISKASEKMGFSRSKGYSLMKSPAIQSYINEKLCQPISNNIANSFEIMQYLTKVMRGQDFDEKTSIKERLRAAELLGKAQAIFSSKIDEKNLEPVIIYGENEIFE